MEVTNFTNYAQEGCIQEYVNSEIRNQKSSANLLCHYEKPSRYCKDEILQGKIFQLKVS